MTDEEAQRVAEGLFASYGPGLPWLTTESGGFAPDVVGLAEEIKDMAGGEGLEVKGLVPPGSPEEEKG